jgi:Squalene-hopene cyclase C-terminal domain
MTYADGGVPESTGYALLALSANGRPRDSVTAAQVRNLAARQLPDGEWHPAGPRPPLEFSDATPTALAIHALQIYAPQRLKRQYAIQIQRAQSWLLSAKVESTEDAVFQLLGLSWSGANLATLQRLAQNLLAKQRADGGWAQLTTLQSDTYATGQTLYALNQAGGVPVSDPAYRKGVEFLRKTQLADGSWFVKSRTLPLIPYFESGFPHGRNQFISAAGTGWAVMALMLAVEPQPRLAARSSF